MIALVDCNNFFVSCERVFNPKLQHIPVVVLSNNDGCIIARSNEVKALGIPMGAPFFQYRDLIEQCSVAVFSSNFALYGDLSHRVMRVLQMHAPRVAIYSIDEAFLDFEIPNPCAFAKKLKRQVLQWVGIPVSIGIAPTKTLAKIANRYAKKHSETGGVYVLENIEEMLKNTPVEDIWGIGSRLKTRLHKKQIYTAWDLRNADDVWVKKQMGVVGLRTVYELRGISCLSLEEAPLSKKSISTCKGFGKLVTDYEELKRALSAYTARIAEKLRKQKAIASYLTVFVVPKSDQSYCLSLVLPEPTAYTPLLIHFAKQLLHGLYREGVAYRKVGVLFDGLLPEHFAIGDLFAESSTPLHRQNALMQVLDALNRRRKVARFAAEGVEESWKMRQERRSPRFTTRWDELLTI